MRSTFFENFSTARLRRMDFANLNTKEAADLYCDGEKCEVVLPTIEPAVVPQEEFEFSFEKPDSGNGSRKKGEEIGVTR